MVTNINKFTSRGHNKITYPYSGDSQDQEFFLAHSADK